MLTFIHTCMKLSTKGATSVWYACCCDAASPRTLSTTNLLVCPPRSTGTALLRVRLPREVATGLTRTAVLTLGIPHTTDRLPVSRSLMPGAAGLLLWPCDSPVGELGCLILTYGI